MKSIAAATLAAALLSGPALAKEEGHGLSQGDQQFIKEASMGNLAEVHMGTLAVAKGSTPAIREFGRWMISTHSFANRELATIVERMHGEKPSMQRESKAEEMMGKLQNLKGTEFDKAYLEAMEKDHEEDVKKIGAEARNGQDFLVKSFAANFEPAVKEHLAQIKVLQADMKNQGQGAAEADANMKAAAGGMKGTPEGNNAQAKQVQQQHK